VSGALKNAGIEAKLTPARPNLEDVFVAATRSSPRAQEAAA
jgi:hypothetical protein